jgi:glutamate--cysteine ligase
LFQLDNLPGALLEPSNAPLLTGILRGVEKESLRTTADGRLSQSTHPQTLGSALTHPQITTDFSEALLEFITPPSHRIDEVLANLDTIHRFTHAQLGDEMLWCHSMPCALPADHEIPVGRYGTSNVGRMKTIYREGLGHRYGRVMQTVAGIHYNFSLPNAFWAFLHASENSSLNLDDFRTSRYFDLIRNFRRHYWLLIYLFGASPAVCSSFVKGRQHDLTAFNGSESTLHMPFATSMRMGDLGYQSKTQESLYVCYNQLPTYLQTLVHAIKTPYPLYEELGTRDRDGHYRQLNTGLLQIENEFYSAIRPKRTARSGETALTALCHRGVEYVEVRCLDLNPYEPLGIGRAQMQFLDTFLLYCLLHPSPKSTWAECELILSNQKQVVKRGREPGLMLDSGEHGKLSLQTWAQGLLQALQPVADMLDQAHSSDDYRQSLQQQAAKVADPSQTPSALILSEMRSKNLDFSQFATQHSQQQSASFKERPLQKDQLATLQATARQSLYDQAALEAADNQDFEAYLAGYYEQYGNCQSTAAEATAE